jgi:hypothetical protein
MATATQWAYRKQLDTRQRSSTSRQFEDALAQKIDRHPSGNGLAFLRGTEQRSSYAQMPFVASNSTQFAAAEIRG